MVLQLETGQGFPGQGIPVRKRGGLMELMYGMGNHGQTISRAGLL